MTDNIGIEKLFCVNDERVGVWFDIYQAKGADGASIILEVPRETRRLNDLQRLLLRSGADASVANDNEKLAAAIKADAPIRLRPAYTGWRNDGRTFVSHLHVAGVNEDDKILTPALLDAGPEQPKILGTLYGWQQIIEVAQHSTSLTLALCAAFAAPLLELVERPNFAVMLHGPSRSGKSMAQLVAASVVGIGREEHLPNLNATQAGLLETGLANNGHLLVLNEIGTASGAKRDIYNALRTSGYQLMGGRDVQRHSRWIAGQSAGPKTFRIIGLLSSEISPDAWAERSGETRDPGEMARVIGVPVLMRGSKTIFDCPPKEISDEHLAAWTSQQFGLLREGLPQHRGLALPRYLDYLLENTEDRRDEAAEIIDLFERVHQIADRPLFERDIVAKFAVLLVGGIFARRAGVLPLRKRWICQAVRRSCLTALQELSDPAADLRDDRRMFKERLRGGGMIDLDDASGKQRRMLGDADGYFQTRGNGLHFVVRAQVVASWFRGLVRHQRVLQWLDMEGFLDSGRSRGSGRSAEWAQRQITWPDETRVRSISIFLPRGLDDLDRGA